MKFRGLILIGILSSFIPSIAQKVTSAEERAKNETIHAQLDQESLVKGIRFTNIGPTIMSGRVVDMAINPENPSEFYVAYATGGLWYTKSNGAAFKPLFQNESTITIGDIAVDWKSKTVWLGSGENNSSRSSYSGTGMFKSTDGGKNWTYVGLPESHHTGRILINPTDPNHVVVGVIGHLYSDNKERGIYVTKDGGTTWQQTLFVNERTGVIDMVAHPKNFNEMYAASWERDRKAWDFTESGEGTAIYKSTDAGQSWTKVTGGESGFAQNEGMGRIGLDMANDGTLYATIDNQNPQSQEKKELSPMDQVKEQLRTASADEFFKMPADKIKKYLQKNRFPKSYSYEMISAKIKQKEITPKALVDYIEDENTRMFNQNIKECELYVSKDGGKTFQLTHNKMILGVVNTYGYYFGQVRVAPNNSKRVYIMGVPLLFSANGGKDFKSIGGANVHSDHHYLWINPNNENHIINGNDGGVNISYDNGKNWFKCNAPSVGQFYSINVDNAKPYNVYGGLQDNGVWKGPHTNKESVRWHSLGKYSYDFIMGGDGMNVEVDSRDNNQVYTGSQYGNYFAINKVKNEFYPIKPKHKLGERPLRFNWQSPILLSSHNQDILYFGANRLYRSMNKGKDMQAISPDLTKGGREGNVAYGTLTTISESRLKFGLLYCGSDDGLVHVSKDGGASWTKITNGLPADLWVSRVQASHHKESRVYLALNGYRYDHFETYVYVSEDYGQNWKRLNTSNLPLDPANVLKEDPQYENFLYLGTDGGIYVSLDRGENFQKMGMDLPSVPVHDLIVQEEARDLVIATHGRSIYRADISSLSSLANGIPSLTDFNLMVLTVPEVRFDPMRGKQWSKWYTRETEDIKITVWSSVKRTFSFQVYTENGEQLYKHNVDLEIGINEVSYDLSLIPALLKRKSKFPIPEKSDDEKYYLPKGSYEVKILGGKGMKLEVK